MLRYYYYYADFLPSHATPCLLPRRYIAYVTPCCRLMPYAMMPLLIDCRHSVDTLRYIRDFAAAPCLSCYMLRAA